MTKMKIPLAWRQLALEKKRFAVALLGVTFALILILFQLGIYRAFLNMVIRPVVSMKGELAMLSRDTIYLMKTVPFPERRLFQALALPEVRAVYPVMVGFALWRNPQTGYHHDIALFGAQRGRNPFFQPAVTENEYILGLPDGVFYDSESVAYCGDVKSILAKKGVLNGEISGHRVRVLGMFEMGRTLASSGTALVGLETFCRLVNRDADQINIGMIELAEGADPQELARQLNQILPEDVEVITRSEFIHRERKFWKDATPVGYIITGGMIIAMLVGAVIVYQILYTDINDHLKEYATLKALGMNDRFFLSLIFQQSFILLGISFLPGLGISFLLFRFTRWRVGIPTYLSYADSFLALGLTALMCACAGYFATRCLRSADPADIF